MSSKTTPRVDLIVISAILSLWPESVERTMRIPIRYQFMLPLLAVAILSLLAVGVINARLATSQTQERIERRLQGVVAVLAESTYPLTNTVLDQMGGLAHAEFGLTDADGNVLASGTSLNLEGLGVDKNTAEQVKSIGLGREVQIEGVPYFHSSIWVKRRPFNSEPCVLHILFSREEYTAVWRAAFIPPLMVGLATIFAIGIVTHLVAGRVSRNLALLGNEVQRLAEGDFSPVTQSQWNDETRDLSVAVNQTAGRLETYEKELRQTERLQAVAMLGAGLAHEMRNAATGCRLAVDLHAEQCHEQPADDSLSVARRQLVLMESKLQQLLHLGKVENSVTRESFDFAALVSEIVDLVRPTAQHAGTRLDWVRPEQPMAIYADAEMLSQAVMNVVLNALDAAAKSAWKEDGKRFVKVELASIDSHLELSVADSGDGPGDDLGDQVFEPFVTSKEEGTGLGLAVTKRVVETFGGRIGWQRLAGMTTFRIRLPLHAAGVNYV